MKCVFAAPGIQFQGLRDAGDPVELALAYQEQGADEIVFLDISATGTLLCACAVVHVCVRVRLLTPRQYADEERKTAVEVVKRVRQSLRVPLTVGGGISSLADAHSLLMAGADKVSVNSAAVRDPTLISSLATCFGSQCVVCAIDATQKAGSCPPLSHCKVLPLHSLDATLPRTIVCRQERVGRAGALRQGEHRT